MRTILAVVAVLYSAAALAQTEKPPMVGDKPLVQVKPKAGAAKGKGEKAGAKEKPEAAAKGKPQSTAVRLQACLDIDDGTKDRLNCYDAVLSPTPKPKAGKAKAVSDCRFTKEEDERLACYNGFVESMPKLPKS
jgi:hypothetical protein